MTSYCDEENQVYDHIHRFKFDSIYGFSLNQNDIRIIKNAEDRWYSVIYSGVNYNLTNIVNMNRVKVEYHIYENLSGGAIGSVYYNPSTFLNTILFKRSYWEENIDYAYYIVLHELGHALGIRQYNLELANLFYRYTNGVRDYTKYIGQNGVKEYSSWLGNNVTYLPFEDGGGSGTYGSHPEEGDNIRTENGITLHGLDSEIMTGWLDYPPVPLSRISIGILEDLGYNVSYTAADQFSKVNRVQLNKHENKHENKHRFCNCKIHDTNLW
jgi:hypothetical protein